MQGHTREFGVLMKNKVVSKLAASIAAALLFLACANSASSSSSSSSSSSKSEIPDIAVSLSPANSWGSGWNLGNTLDANYKENKNNLGLSTETSWGMPETTEEMIKAVAAKGFKTIRIPVSWHNHITESSGHKIDQEWLSRVKTIVDWSLAAGMNAIINIHHDNLTEEQMSTTYGFCVPENNDELKNQSKTYIKDIWTQVADYFKDYGDNLIFELLNEPRAVGTDYEWYTPSGMESNVAAANVIIKEYEQAALDAIRYSGGNNESRYVMVPPYAASPDMTNSWSLPTDSASGKLIVSVHAYTPYDFCMGDDTTFTSAHKNNIEGWLFSDKIKEPFLSKNIPVIIGETSASDKGNSGERNKWAKCFFGAAKNLNVSCILWDNMNCIQKSNVRLLLSSVPWK